MVYAKAFFDFQLKFAQSVAALSELPLDHALLAHTNLYIRFGLGRDFDRAHPDRIRLHFENTDAAECSSLGSRRRDQRLADLAALFARVKLAEPGDVSVVGSSWLYNLEAYRRLFPKSYVASTRVLLGRFQHMPLVGPRSAALPSHFVIQTLQI